MADPVRDALDGLDTVGRSLTERLSALRAAVDKALPPPVIVAPPPVRPPPPPPVPQAGVLLYHGITDRTPRPKPAPLQLGAAGFAFNDPTYGSAMLRVTDRQTAGGGSCRVPSNAHLSAWNTDSSRFYVVGEGGGAVVFAFDKAALRARVLAVPGPRGFDSQCEPAFSYVDPDVLYGIRGLESRTVQRTRLSTGTVEAVLDLDVAYPAVRRGYTGGMLTTDHDVWAVLFGGDRQDLHHLIHHSTAGLFNSMTQPVPFHLHGFSMDRTGQYVLLYTTNADIEANKAARRSDPSAPALFGCYIWNTKTGTVVPNVVNGGGHDENGYGCTINQASGSGEYDAMQWQYRELANPGVTRDLIPTVLRPKLVYAADHSSWRAARPDVRVPLISSTYRYAPEDTPVPWRAWDDEIIAVATDFSGTVWRFAHHQSVDVRQFWNQPFVNVDPSGRYALFTTNWGGTLGAGKQDVLLVTLK